MISGWLHSLRQRDIWLLLCTIVELAAFVALVALDHGKGTLRAEAVPYTLICYYVGFGAYLAALWILYQHQLPGWLLWGQAIVLRLVLLATGPTLSDDVFRYLWDGFLSNQGVSPYAFRVDSLVRLGETFSYYQYINHPQMASPYLPSAQWLFAFITGHMPVEPFTVQVVMVILDLLLGWVIIQVLRRCQLPDRYTAIYLWHPLVILEVAHSAHLEPWMSLLMLLAVWFALAPNKSITGKVLRTIGSPLFLALATLTKPIPLLVVPILARRWRWTGFFLYLILLLLIAWAAVKDVGLGVGSSAAGTGLLGAIRIYVQDWAFNSGVYALFRNQLNRMGVVDAEYLSKIVLVSIMVIVELYTWLLARRLPGDRQMVRLIAIPLGAYMVLTPTLHPWYLLALLVYLPMLAPGKGEPRQQWLLSLPWLYLSGAVMLSYLTYLDPSNWRELAWVRYAQWVPTWLLLGISFVWLWQVRHHGWTVADKRSRGDRQARRRRKS